MPDLEIVFRTKAELEGAKQTETQLERDIGKAKALGKDFADLEAQLKKVKASIAAAGKPEGPGLGEMFGKIREGLGEVIPGFAKLDGILGKFAGGALGAIAAGFAVLAAGLESAKRSIEEFANAEQHVAKLDAALAQSGHLTNEYRERLQELAHEFQNTTGVAEDQWLGVLTRLTQFGADSTNIDHYAEGVKNLAGILGGDVQTAAMLLSRALQGNFQMFARYGIQVDEAGTQTEKLEGLMLQLAQRGGGQLEAVTNTLGGRFRELQNNTNDLFKAFGRGVASTGILQGALQLVADGVGYWAEKLGGPIAKVDGLGNAAVSTTQKIESSVPSDAYEKGLKKIETAANLALLKVQGLKDATVALKTASDEVADVFKQGEVADVDKQVASGAMTKSEGDRKKAEIEARHIKDSADREKAFLDLQDNQDAGDVQVKDYAVKVAEQKLYEFRTMNKRMGPVNEAKANAQRDEVAVKNAEMEQEILKGATGKAGSAAQGVFAGVIAAMPGVGPLLSGFAGAGRVAEQKRLDDLNESIPKLKEIAEHSAERFQEVASNHAKAGDPKKLEEEIQKAKDDAATAQQQFENARKLRNIKRAALDATTPEKLRTLGVQTGVKLIGDHEEESHQAMAAAQQYQKTGIATASGKTVAAIQANTQLTAGALDAVTKAVQVQNEELKRRIKLLESQANENRNRGN